ncbi:P-loop containing nucleoside triphosphate hydrolase protein [Suillus ampliporus]|nr:P-loop containing nucleoside triphosphate hydrolase protein [Suillus ampliporus]
MASTPAPNKLTRSVPFTPKRPLSSTGTPRSQTPTSHINTSDMDVSCIDPEDALVDYQTVKPSDVSADIDEGAIPGPNYGKEDKVLVSIRIRPTASAHPAWDHSVQRTIKLFPQYAKSTATAPPEFQFDEVLTGSENMPVYNAVARSHVCAAMDGYNSVIFAYGQTASGKTFTLSGNEDQPGIIPRAMKDVFAYIRRTPSREYLLRCSYLEIYNETIYDLLAPPSMSAAQPVQIQGSGILVPLREEVVTSLKSVKEVLERGERNRRTASTDWNERSSRSHSVFRLVVESRERGEGRSETPSGPSNSQRATTDAWGSSTTDNRREKRADFGAENAANNKKSGVVLLTRLLQPSLSGDARISVICTINPDANAVAESTSTLLFAQRIKRVQDADPSRSKLNAKKEVIVDTDALIERYRKEIDDLKKKLSEREAETPARNHRLSAREQIDESKAMKDLDSRIRQLTKLILTSQTMDESKGDESCPATPFKVDFDMSPYQLQQELLAARLQLESQSTQILSLEAALLSRSELPPNASEPEKDKPIIEQAKTVLELEIVVRGYEDNLGEPLRAVREDVEKEWVGKLEEEVKKREDKEAWAAELVRQLEKEQKLRIKLEKERRALAAVVSKFDSLGLGLSSALPSKLKPAKRMPGGASAAVTERYSVSLFDAGVAEVIMWTGEVLEYLV